MTAIYTVKEPRPQKKKNSKRKKPTAKTKQRRGNDRRTQQSKQPTVKPGQRRRCGIDKNTITRKPTAAEIKIGKQQRW